jgi:replicative DNA helicase
MFDTDIQQPFALDAEEMVVSSCLLPGDEGATFDVVSQIVQADDFYDQSCKIIYGCMAELAKDNKPIDEITIFDRIRRKSLEDQVGGIGRLYSIQERAATSLMALSSARIVKERSQARSLLRASRGTIESILGGVTAENASTELDKTIREIIDGDKKAEGIKEAADSLKDKFDAMSEGTYKFTSLSTGIDHLDAKLDEGGIGKGEVFVISAPTSCGKSQLALNIVLRAAVSQNKPVGIFSFEMPAEQLTKRMTQTASAVNLARFKDRVATEKDKEAVYTSLERIKNAPIYTEHHVRNIEDLRSKSRSLKRKHGIEALVIDYLQLIPYDTKMSKAEGISFISHGIKQLAIELNIPVILLAQVNREGAKRDSGLGIHDLRDSGDIENDADVILLMWAKGGDLNNCRFSDGTTEFIELDYKIAKNREGQRDLMGKFKFINQIGRFK